MIQGGGDLTHLPSKRGPLFRENKGKISAQIAQPFTDYQSRVLDTNKIQAGPVTLLASKDFV